MVILIRIVLVGIIIYLLVRSFYKYFQGGDDKKVQGPENNNSSRKKKISKEVGEYIDYEEIKEDD